MAAPSRCSVGGQAGMHAFELITRALSFRTQISLAPITAIYFQPATQEK